jgi:hypothetical protein
MLARRKIFTITFFFSPFLFPYINFGIMIYWDNETAMFKKAHTNGTERFLLCVQRVKSLKIESFVCLSSLACSSTASRKNSLNSAQTREHSQKKNRVSWYFLVYYTHISDAHMRWWWWCESNIRKRRHFWTWTLPEIGH